LMELLRAEVEGQERAALVALHDLDAAARYADRVIVMQGGAIVSDGSPAEILASRVIADVFGIERGPDGWQPALRPRADPRSSR